MKVIYNGIPCEVDMNNGSSAPVFKFANFEDAMRAFHGEKECEYCHKTFHPFVIETVNGKLACESCREQLVPPIVAYMDRYKRMWAPVPKPTDGASPTAASEDGSTWELRQA